jgi:hypothetical protein
LICVKEWLDASEKTADLKKVTNPGERAEDERFVQVNNSPAARKSLGVGVRPVSEMQQH